MPPPISVFSQESPKLPPISGIIPDFKKKQRDWRHFVNETGEIRGKTASNLRNYCRISSKTLRLEANPVKTQ